MGWFFVLSWQTVMQLLKPAPADTPLDLLDRFPFPDQDTQRLAVQRITGLQFADREGGGESCLAHGSNVLDATNARSAALSGAAPAWGQSLA
jgi:hypothetical protein